MRDPESSLGRRRWGGVVVDESFLFRTRFAEALRNRPTELESCDITSAP